MTKTVAERVREHRKRKKKSGLVEVRVWVPPDSAPLIRDLARQLNK